MEEKKREDKKGQTGWNFRQEREEKKP
ncbi:hypothetical protein CLS_33950 [[Clostridium] cf. saccharolyticum K10]|nr:hypothetical protein CLS_33950 [[Clostridium] cf. saccharolyticum K10]